MKLWHCPHCDSTNVYIDACVGANDQSDVQLYDDWSCSDCGYDGHMFEEREVSEDHDHHLPHP